MEGKHTQETTEIRHVNKAKKFPQFLAAIIGELAIDQYIITLRDHLKRSMDHKRTESIIK